MGSSGMFKLVRKSKEAPCRRVCMVGVGDAGGRAISGVLGGAGGEGTLAVINTDSGALAGSGAATRVQIGRCNGMDAATGGDPALGRAAAERDLEMIRGLISGCDALILAAGLGGGTGTGAAPVVLSAARASGMLTLALVTLPFSFEGPIRQRRAQEGLQAITAASDFTAYIANDTLFAASAMPDNGAVSAFARADEALSAGLCALWHMLAQPMLLGVDPGGLRILAEKAGGACVFGFSSASGTGRVRQAVEGLTSGPVLQEGTVLRKCPAALLGICGSHDMTLQEVGDTVLAIHECLPPDCDLQIGAGVNDAWRNRIFVSLFLVPDARRTVNGASGGVRRSAESAVSRKSGRSRAAQKELNFESGVGRGRFSNVAATFLDGEDLDTPTFIRRGITLEK